MTQHIYAFGSICRGEVDRGSDIDLLACSDSSNSHFDPKKFSIYTYERISQLWEEGNPFAWHLHLESRLLYASDGEDFVERLGAPHPYKNCQADCEKFQRLFNESCEALRVSKNSAIFHLSCIFLSIRNLATCYSFRDGVPIFSRRSPLMIASKLDIHEQEFDLLVRARILSTRGIGVIFSSEEIDKVLSSLPVISNWMINLLSEFKND